jgi:hexosaminidase
LQLSDKSRIVVTGNSTDEMRLARQLSEDYALLFGTRLSVVKDKVRKGDISLRLTSGKKLGQEGYRMQIADKVALEAATPRGLFYATRTLLQLTEMNRALPCGSTVDVPQYALRGFMIDCGRKFIPMSYLRSLVRMMAYYKMNTLQIHLNDNAFKGFYNDDWSQTYAAFRMECATYPGLTARDGYYTKQEFIALQELADSCGVEIIPEIDSPAHSLAFTQYKPELGSREYGMDHLDLSNPNTYTFMDALFKEYLEGPNPVFRGKRVHIGTDEYSNAKQEVVEQFRAYTDHYIRLVESYGKQACIWGALTHAKGTTPVKSDHVVMGCWYNGYAQPKDMKAAGYQLVSIPDGLVYIVPAAGYYYDYLNTEYLYTKWSPRFIGKEEFQENDPQLLGGMFAVWNDHSGNGISVKDIHHRVAPALQTLSAKMWDGDHTTCSFALFDSLRRDLSEAPGVNELGRIGTPHTEVLTLPTLAPDTVLPYDGIGYNYTISFHLTAASEAPGTELFRSQSSVFYLADPISGRFAFARDGYLYTFRYRPFDGEEADLRIEGTNTATRLYVNGRLLDNFDIQPIYYSEKKNLRNCVRTLFFPLRHSGNFKSRITSLSVRNFVEP